MGEARSDSDSSDDDDSSFSQEGELHEFGDPNSLHDQSPAKNE